MEAPTDTQIIDRLRYADGDAVRMSGDIGLGNWTLMTSMALAFYALKSDDPGTTAGENMDRASLIVSHFGGRAGEWQTGEADGDASSVYADRDVWIHLFMQSQDYLNSVVEGYFSTYGAGHEAEAIAEIGNHINVSVAASCMRFSDPQAALQRCRENVERTITFVREQCSFVEE